MYFWWKDYRLHDFALTWGANVKSVKCPCIDIYYCMRQKTCFLSPLKVQRHYSNPAKTSHGKSMDTIPTGTQRPSKTRAKITPNNRIKEDKLSPNVYSRIKTVCQVKNGLKTRLYSESWTWREKRPPSWKHNMRHFLHINFKNETNQLL